MLFKVESRDVTPKPRQTSNTDIFFPPVNKSIRQENMGCVSFQYFKATFCRVHSWPEDSHIKPSQVVIYREDLKAENYKKNQCKQRTLKRMLDKRRVIGIEGGTSNQSCFCVCVNSGVTHLSP